MDGGVPRSLLAALLGKLPSCLHGDLSYTRAGIVGVVLKEVIKLLEPHDRFCAIGPCQQAARLPFSM